MDRFILALGGALWLLWAFGIIYLLLLTAGAALYRHHSRPIPQRRRRFCLLIPAHNEELLLGTVLDRLRTLDYPVESYQIVVIADNCTDRTAEVAAEHGTRVLVRESLDERGKGYALAWALKRLLAPEEPTHFDAFVVMDADSCLSPNFLRVMNAALEQGHRVIQGYYTVENLHASWRTRLMACALALAHYVRPLGRNHFGLSDGLKGNGMCFSRAVLERVPWSGESITEDIEHTLRLVRNDIRIEFAPEAVVLAQMPTTARQSASQRQRWEGGRYALFRRALGLLRAGLRARRWMIIDRALELIIPPFVELFTLPALFLLGAALWLYADPSASAAWWMLWAWGGVLAAELLYLAAGLTLARIPLSAASALLFAPLYVAWKFSVYGAMLLRRGVGGWKRTERHALAQGAQAFGHAGTQEEPQAPEHLSP